MSWLQRMDTIFLFVLFLVIGLYVIVRAAEVSVRNLIEFYLTRKKEMIAKLEEELGDDKQSVSHQFGSH